MEKAILNFIINFFLKELCAWEAQINWTSLEAKLDEHIKLYFPYKWMDAGLISFSDYVFKSIQVLLSEQEELAGLLTAIENKNYNAALVDFEEMIVTAFPALAAVLKVK